jgi:hypothetical protein
MFYGAKHCSFSHERSIRQFPLSRTARRSARARLPNDTSMTTRIHIKLRQFAELLTQLVAAKTGLYEAGDESQADLLRRLRFERVLPPQVADLFHTLRIQTGEIIPAS